MRDHDIARFWTFLPERPDEPDACWSWYGATSGTDKRTPVFSIKGRNVTATRAAWEVDRGRAPAGTTKVRRVCGNPRCVRPSHLKIGRKEPERVGRGHWGESHPHAKLSDEQVRTVRTLYERGASQGQLARYYGVSQSSLSLMVRGETRAAAGGPLSRQRPPVGGRRARRA